MTTRNLTDSATITGIQSDISDLTTDMAAKAPLASPTLTGTPVAPTAAEGTNTTQIATTAFVQTAVSGVSGGSADHAYYTKLAALLEPDAIEAPNTGTFAKVIASNATRYLLLGWNLNIGGGGRFDIRNPVLPLPLRGVTLNGRISDSIAATLDPTLPTFTDARDTYFDRMNAIAELATRCLSVTTNTSGEVTTPFLPGPYGAIVTSVSAFDYGWVGLGTSFDAGTWPIDYENNDSTSWPIRYAHTMFLPVSKKIVARLAAGYANNANCAGTITYVLLPSTWSTIADPVSASYDFRDDFMGATLDTTTTWTNVESTVGDNAIDTNYAWLRIKGWGVGWGGSIVRSQASYARAAAKHLVVDVYSAGGGIIVGWHDGSGNSYTDFSHGVHFDGAGTLTVYEDSNSRGNVGSGWTDKCVYRLRITPTATGATYEIQGGKQYQPIGGASWTDITPGTTSSSVTPLSIGFAANAVGPHYVGDVRVY